MEPGDAAAARASGTDSAGSEPSSRLFRASVILLVLAPLCSVLGWTGFLFVVGQHAVPGWAIGGVLFVASMVLLKVDAFRQRSITFTDRTRRIPRPWFVTLLAVVSVAFSGLSALDDLSGAKYYVLTPANGTAPGFVDSLT